MNVGRGEKQRAEKFEGKTELWREKHWDPWKKQKTGKVSYEAKRRQKERQMTKMKSAGVVGNGRESE